MKSDRPLKSADEAQVRRLHEIVESIGGLADEVREFLADHPDKCPCRVCKEIAAITKVVGPHGAREQLAAVGFVCWSAAGHLTAEIPGTNAMREIVRGYRAKVAK